VKLSAADIDEALALSEAEGWNQTAADWRRLVELEPDGCFVVRDGERLAGTVTTTTYGSTLAWIGMMIVHPDQRRRGIGATLMRTALDYLEERGVTTIKLDATPAGRPLYESLGFVAEVELERWQGIAPIRTAPNRIRSSHDPARPLIDLDRAAYGVDRARLIESLVADGAVDPIVATRTNDQITGYALARRGRIATYIGPIVAENATDAERLLDGALARLAGQEVCLDLHRGGFLEPATLTARGSSRRRMLLRMRYGEPNAAATARSICASTGPEYG
jgi:GNAT superfamily N-acetyltransferase